MAWHGMAWHGTFRSQAMAAKPRLRWKAAAGSAACQAVGLAEGQLGVICELCP